jgi:hypothetical protein
MQAASNYPPNCGLATTSEFARQFAKRGNPGFQVSLARRPRYFSAPTQASAVVQDRSVTRYSPTTGVYDLAVEVTPVVAWLGGPYTTISDDESVLASESDGVLSHVANGTVMLSTTAASGEVVRTRAAAENFSGGVVDEFFDWGSGTGGEAFTDSVEDRMPASVESPAYGTGFTNGLLNMFTPPGPYGASGWKRNPNFWLSGIDWSCLSVRNSVGHARGGVLVSPRYAIAAAHFDFSPGQTLTFVTADDQARVRTVDSVTNFPVFTSYDTCLIRFTEPLTYADDGIAFCKVFPGDYADYLPGATRVGAPSPSQRGIPVLRTNQDKLMGAGRCLLPSSQSNFSAPGGDFSGSFYPAAISIRYLDSGHPVFALIGTEPVLLGTWTNVSAGSNFTGNAGFQEAINAVMANDSESLTAVDLSEFPTY